MAWKRPPDKSNIFKCNVGSLVINIGDDNGNSGNDEQVTRRCAWTNGWANNRDIGDLRRRIALIMTLL